LNIVYKGQIISKFRADIVVNDKITIEIKAVNEFAIYHEAQLINYLKATGLKVGLLVNYGRKFEFKRIIH
jgi:GxxExxY protein